MCFRFQTSIAYNRSCSIKLVFRCSLGYEPFCEAIRNLFGNDVSTQDLKALFRKIALNPDAQVDWSEVCN